MQISPYKLVKAKIK